MDYTPISTRRVLVAFGLTGFVAVLPVLYFVIRAGADGPLSAASGLLDTPRAVLLAGGFVVLTAALIAVSVLMMSIGRRLMRRPARA